MMATLTHLEASESRSLDGVFFIPRLTTNIMSVSQHDEVGYKIYIDTNMMKMREPDEGKARGESLVLSPH
jgi:hypothetical protein